MTVGFRVEIDVAIGVTFFIKETFVCDHAIKLDYFQFCDDCVLDT